MGRNTCTCDYILTYKYIQNFDRLYCIGDKPVNYAISQVRAVNSLIISDT
jgi:hypothetical protein